MGISRAIYDSGKGTWDNSPFTDIQAGTTQIKRVMINSVEIWNAGVFSAAIIDGDGSGPIAIVDGTYTFNVISSTGSGTGGQITGTVDSRRLDTITSVVDGGSGHAIGDILTVEEVAGGWFVNPEIEVTAL